MSARGSGRAVALILALALLSPSILMADEKKDGAKPYSLDAVNVTAQKREENVQDVPMSMDVFNGSDLEDSGALDLDDILLRSTNLYQYGAGTDQVIIIRGINSFDGSLRAPAGLYVDGAAFPIQQMGNPALFDVERVEVVKGPQGTLYGRNTESGVINIVTKRPDNEIRANLYGEYESYNTGRLGGSVSGPIFEDTLYMGVALQSRYTDGYWENLTTGSDEADKELGFNGRTNVRWTPTDNLDISYIADFEKVRERCQTLRFRTGPFASDPHETRMDAEMSADKKGMGHTLKIDYDLGGMMLSSISSYREFRVDSNSDGDLSPLPNMVSETDFKTDVIAEELRLSSDGDESPLQWLVGVYAFDEKTSPTFKFIDFVSAAPAISISDRDTDIHSQGLALFGQTTYTLFDRLHLTAGLRFDHERTKGKFVKKADPAFGLPEAKFEKEIIEDAFLPKFVVAYDFTDDFMAYVSYTEGFLPGGFSWAAATALNNFGYEPEYSTNYEIGMKTSWLDDRLVANVSAFYIEIEDKQVFEFDPGGFTNVVRNAGKAHTQGLEIDVQARPLKGLDVFAGLGILQTEIDKWLAREFAGPYNYKGKKFNQAPTYTFNIGAQYRHASGWFGRAEVLGAGEQYADLKNTIKEDSYELLNLRAGYSWEDVDISAWCNNVLNEEFVEMSYDYMGAEAVHDGDPRTFGLEVNARF